MPIYETAVEGNNEPRPVKPKVRRAPLIAELFELVDGDLQLLLIYKKIEIAAEAGDWPLMNQLYGEFKIAHAALN
jgi:hypothetical protein